MIAITPMPIGYYSMLRWVVFGSTVWSAKILLEQNFELSPIGSNVKSIIGKLLIVIAIVFNPVIPIETSKSNWIRIDIIAFTILLLSVIKIRLFLRQNMKLFRVDPDFCFEERIKDKLILGHLLIVLPLTISFVLYKTGVYYPEEVDLGAYIYAVSTILFIFKAQSSIRKFKADVLNSLSARCPECENNEMSLHVDNVQVQCQVCSHC